MEEFIMLQKKIGVIGLGVVGQAVRTVFQEKHSDVIGYDTKNPADVFEDLLSSDFLFLCLPSPTAQGKQDLSAIEQTLAKLEAAKYNGVVVLKSTVLPGTTARLQKTVSFDMVHNPEFLSAKSALEDFRHQKTILIGSLREKALTKVWSLYFDMFADTQALIHIGTSDETEMAKYMSNVFFAVKVGVFNEFYQVCQELGISYQNSVDAATIATDWLHEMHTKVPGTDGQMGWGGMCFPKDVIAFTTLLKGNSIIKTAMEKNIELRPEEMLKLIK
jgi:nucleotide sugar dehydrogenase